MSFEGIQYPPDALGISIGAPDTFVSSGTPGNTPQNIAAAGVPSVPGITPIAPLSSYLPSTASNSAQTSPAQQSQTSSTGQSTTASLSGFLTLITDLPRMATILAGFILLIVGLATLGIRPAVQVVGKVAEKAGVA